MDIFFSLILVLLKILKYLTHPIYVWASRGKKKTLPPITKDIIYISASDLADKIRKKHLSSEEICKAYIDRIKQVNPVINAVVEDRFEQALKEARNVDDYLTKCSLSAEDLEKIKPLLGVPITVKESCSLRGLSYTGGMLSRSGFKAETDGEAVARLKTSGAIPLLVSSTPELCSSLETYNLITGYTNNPYDTTCTSGGSSGGEGALLGAGASVVGLGSDVAGSIRVPAMYNGVFGHKPSPRIMSLKGHFPYCYDEKFKDFFVIGPMTRYAKDLKLVLKVLVGDKQATQLRLNQEVDLSKIDVFFMEDNGDPLELRVQDEIQDAVRNVVKHLGNQCGATIRSYKFPDFRYALFYCIRNFFTIKDLPQPLKGQNTHLGVEMLKAIFGQSQYSRNLLYHLLIQKIYEFLVTDRTADVAKMRKTFVDHLGENGVFIYPTALSSATKHNEIYFMTPTAVYSAMINSFGCPSTAVPCGFDKSGLPIGIQVVAAPNQDRLCLAVAEELEKRFGGWVPPK